MATTIPIQPEIQIIMTPAELGAACDIIEAIYKGLSNKREYNRLVRSLTEVLTSLLAIRNRRLAKGITLARINHTIDLSSQEVRYVFIFSHDPAVLVEAFGSK